MSQKQIGSGLQVIGAVAFALAAFVFAGLALALLALALVCLVFGVALERGAQTAAVDAVDTDDGKREKPGEV